MSSIRSSAGTLVYNPLLQPDLKLMLAEGDDVGLQQFCEVLNPVIVAEVLQGLPPADIWRVLSSTNIDRQAEIFETIEPSQQIELVSTVDRRHLSQLVEAMSADDRVDLLEHMDGPQLEALLPLIAQAERDEIRKMLSYPDNSAGSIMTTEYASLPENISASEALSRLRQQAPDIRLHIGGSVHAENVGVQPGRAATDDGALIEGADRLGLRVVRVEDRAQMRDVQDLDDPRRERAEGEIAVRVARAGDVAHQQPESAAVEKVHRAEVEDEPWTVRE